MSKHELKFKGVLDKTDVTAHLENLVQALRQGRINLQHDDEILSLNPGPALKWSLRLKSNRKRKKSSWR